MNIDLWHDIRQVYHSQLTLGEKYALLYNMLHRVCAQLLADDAATYSDFFSRLQAVCRLTGYPLHGIDQFRWRARRIRDGEAEAVATEFAADFGEFVKAYARFTASEIPPDIKTLVSAAAAAVTSPHSIDGKWLQSARMVAVRKESGCILATCRDIPRQGLWRVDCSRDNQTTDALELISEGMQFNVVDCTADEERGTMTPEMIVLLPDYLIDVSTLCSCLKHYGDTPLNYLLGKIRPDAPTRYTLLGGVAGQFLDDCVNRTDASYTDSIRRAFKQNLLAFTTTDGIDADFFHECERQFANIHQALSALPDSHEAQLEPSFFCETLGLQGRFDYLSFDLHRLIELKSGKWDAFRQCAQREHLMQMILYKEIMHYNLGLRRLDVEGLLLYSKYPMLLEQRTAHEMVEHMMQLRNAIITMERNICRGQIDEYIDRLTPDSLNINADEGTLWTKYTRPELERLLRPLHDADSLTRSYFSQFFTFISREQWLAHVGDGRIDSSRGMASLWCSDMQTKIDNGDIITPLSLSSQDGERVALTRLDTDSRHSGLSFRTGDAVILYVHNTPADTPVNRQVVRCNMVSITADEVVVEMRTPCVSPHIFNASNRFAMEHDYVDSNMRSLYQGLYSLITTSASRRDLLLGRRKPEVDSGITLTTDIADKQLRSIVLGARRALDYYLLVGPPGTGKTSVALRAMVDEFSQSGSSLLLMAYTNRAVDEICSMLAERPYLRIGRSLTCDAPYRQHLIEAQVGDSVRRDDVARLLLAAPIVVGTVSSITASRSLMNLRQFDVAIIDEASQVLEPGLMSLLCYEVDCKPAISKFVMIGDHRQLPAVVVQDEQMSKVENPALHAIGLTDCRNSLFQRLYALAPPEVKGQLTHQGRMHPDIARYAADMFYEGRLLPVGLKHQTAPLPYIHFTPEQQTVATQRVAFFDVPAPPLLERQVKMNLGEAQQIAHIVCQLRDLARQNSLTFCPHEQIGVIVPYRRQITMVRDALTSAGIDDADHMLIDTVERYQGSQKDIIIYGTTITRPYELDTLSNIVEQDGTLVDRKLNVAITRARLQLFIVGNRHLLMQNAVYRELIEEIER